MDKGGQQLAAGIVAFLALIGAFVALTLAHEDATGLVALGAPVVGALLVTGHVSKITSDQNATIAKIDEDVTATRRQTNGVMDARIRDGVQAVLRDSGLIPAADPVESGDAS